MTSAIITFIVQVTCVFKFLKVPLTVAGPPPTQIVIIKLHIHDGATPNNVSPCPSKRAEGSEPRITRLQTCQSSRPANLAGESSISQ